MSSVGERKCALLLTTLHASDRRRLLARLPESSARVIRALVAELERQPMPVAEAAQEVLAQELQGLTATTSLDLDQLIGLSRRLPAPWFAHVLSVWTGVDREFCLATLDRENGEAVRSQMSQMPPMPPQLVAAIRAEAARLAQLAEAA